MMSSRYHKADISVAVATPTGLITPIVKDVGSRGLASISTTTKELVKKARDNKLKPDEYQGGTFTISNLGMFGVSNFTAIINPPQTCILAVGTNVEKVVSDPESDKGFKAIQVMEATLSADHRVSRSSVSTLNDANLLAGGRRSCWSQVDEGLQGLAREPFDIHLVRGKG